MDGSQKNTASPPITAVAVRERGADSLVPPLRHDHFRAHVFRSSHERISAVTVVTKSKQMILDNLQKRRIKITSTCLLSQCCLPFASKGGFLVFLLGDCAIHCFCPLGPGFDRFQECKKRQDPCRQEGNIPWSR
jgi:hypothetical protein